MWLQGTDHTLFAKIVGFIEYKQERLDLPGRPPKPRRYINVMPLNNDWSADYQEKMAAMVAARREAKMKLLGPRAKFVMRLGRNAGLRNPLLAASGRNSARRLLASAPAPAS